MATRMSATWSAVSAVFLVMAGMDGSLNITKKLQRWGRHDREFDLGVVVVLAYGLACPVSVGRSGLSLDSLS